MKKSCILVEEVEKLVSLQMVRNSPRGTLRSLVTVPLFLHGHHRSSLSVYLTTPTITTLVTSNGFGGFHSQSHLDKGMEDQIKEVGDQKTSKLVSDYLLPHILNLYASRATPEDFEIYAPNATFEDPLMCARGVKQIKSAFYSLAKVFKESRIVEYSITEEETSPGKTEVLIDNKQYYKFLGKNIDMISLIKLYTEDGKVVRHEDRWDKKPLSNGETVKTPLLGHIIDAAKKASMFATHALMRFGKDPSPSS